MTVTQSTRKTQSDETIIKIAVKMTKGSKTQSIKVLESFKKSNVAVGLHF